MQAFLNALPTLLVVVAVIAFLAWLTEQSMPATGQDNAPQYASARVTPAAEAAWARFEQARRTRAAARMAAAEDPNEAAKQWGSWG